MWRGFVDEASREEATAEALGIPSEASTVRRAGNSLPLPLRGNPMWTRLALLTAALWACNAMALEGDATYRGYVGASASGSFDVQDTNWSDSFQGGLNLGIWPGAG
jgi:hypothetical protein